MKSYSLVLITGVLFAMNTYAQKEVVIIDKGSDHRTRKKEPRINENTRVLKFAPLNMLIGEINFGYEHKLDNKSSLDFELGPTISEIGFDINSHYIDGYSYSNYAKRSSGLGLVAAVGYRYYPLDGTEALNRFYVSPVLKFRSYSYYASSGDPNVDMGTRKGSETQMNFYFNFGHQAWVSKTFSLDFYCGMGIGYQGVVDYYIESEYIGNDWISSWRKEVGSGARYVFNAGIKVGIGSKSYGNYD